VILGLPALLAFLQATPAPAAAAPGPGALLTVTLLTFESGELTWERFGHNAVWIHDAATGSDVMYDYGRFSFGRTKGDLARFLFNFARGRMWYSMGQTDQVQFVVDFYRNEGRKVWAQELDLTPAQRAQLRDFFAQNIRPENAGYAYDYYRDNCSTRIRDAIDRVVGGSIAAYGKTPSGMTWREETRRLNQHSVLLYSGLMTALGHPVDREMSRWEQMFLPIRLRPHLDSVLVKGPDGAMHPLVKSERVLAEGGRWPVPDRPADWTPWYLVTGVLLAGLMLLTATRARPVFLAIGTLWSLVAGLAGLIITWLMALSAHMAAQQNENLLLFSLLSLALAVMFPSAVRGRAWAREPARRLALLIAALAALALLLKVLPFFRQSNLEIIAFALPVHLSVSAGLSRSPAPS